LSGRTAAPVSAGAGIYLYTEIACHENSGA